MNPTLDADAWNACIDQLYDAVGQEQPLARALGTFRPFVNARGVVFLTIPDVRHPMTSHTASVGVDERSLVDYHTHFNAHDEWVRAASQRSDYKLGATYRGSDLVPRQQLRQSYFWRSFLSQHGVFDILTGLVEAPHREGPASFVTFHRHRGQAPFAVADRLRLQALLPHLRQVLRLHRRVAPALALGATLRELVQRMEQPVLFLAADARVTDCNRAATAALARPGGWLRCVGERLELSAEGRWAGAATWMDDLQRTGSVQVPLVDSEGSTATLDMRAVQGAGTDNFAVHPTLAVCTLNPGPRNTAQVLRTRHGLTAAEARIAVQIAEGRTAQDIVVASGLAMSTVRTHIAAALSKLGLTRQSQLVAQIHAL